MNLKYAKIHPKYNFPDFPIQLEMAEINLTIIIRVNFSYSQFIGKITVLTLIMIFMPFNTKSKIGDFSELTLTIAYGL